ncbi:MAG: hypothetical protein K5905_14545, partial [Roseibium sp.]|nr:hypothetical protein [Roseibium sp.]
MSSYTPGPTKIQHFVAVTVLLGAALGGCSRLNVPIGSNNVDTPTVITGSIASSTDIAYSDINADDRGIIAENLDAIGPELASG